MRLRKNPPLHLTYCLNVHRGESWAENRAAIESHTVPLSRNVARDAAFGLGLRFGARAADELAAPETLREAADLLRTRNLYAFTINGFPYGPFHGTAVKENVYRPDWKTEERLTYTTRLAEILAALLPGTESEGSISTVPGSYKPWCRTRDDTAAIVRRLAETTAQLMELRERTGKEIHLGLEPEPDCLLETTPETVTFFKESLFREGAGFLASQAGLSRERAEAALRRHVGVCLDTCHIALQFEDPAASLKRYREEGIRLSKIQLSNALEVEPTPEAFDALRSFDEPVYLHQVKGRRKDGSLAAWPDLGPALEELPDRDDIERLRIHFHVPLFFERNGPLASTGHSLSPDFFQLLGSGACPHLEIETYTFDVFPESLQQPSLLECLQNEFRWVLARFKQ